MSYQWRQISVPIGKGFTYLLPQRTRKSWVPYRLWLWLTQPQLTLEERLEKTRAALGATLDHQILSGIFRDSP